MTEADLIYTQISEALEDLNIKLNEINAKLDAMEADSVERIGQ